MSDAAQILIYGAMVLVPWLLNIHASKRDFVKHADAVFMATMLCGVWVITNTIGMFIDPPLSKVLHPLIDLGAMAIVVESILSDAKSQKRETFQAWKMTLASLFAAQIVLHLAFWWMWHQQGLSFTSALGQSVYSRYLWMNGMIWTAQLVSAGWPGGRYVAGRIVSRVRLGRRVPAQPRGGGV